MSMMSFMSKFKANKDLATFVILNYIDKFLIFLLPLAVLYISKDRECYNAIEYVYSIANVIAPFFIFFSSYAFYGYKLSLEGNDTGYVNTYRSYSSFIIVILSIIGIIAAFFVSRLVSSLSLLASLMILVRFVYQQTINNNNAYYRLIDKPACLLTYTISGSIFSVVLVYFFHLDQRYTLFAFFLPQLVVSFLCLNFFIGAKDFNIKGFWNYFVNSFKYAWPIVINCTIVALVMNYGKIYAYNYLSSYDMYNFSYIMRISLVIQMAHASLISFYGKELFVKGYSVSFYKKYFWVIGTAFVISVICLFVFNLFVTDKLTIGLTTFLILVYTVLYCLGASFEMWYGRKNQNHLILFVSIFSCLIFFGLIFIIGVQSLMSLALYMIIYALIYLIFLIMIAKAKKLLVGGVGLIPFNRIRIFFYRTFFGYDIDYKSYIGMFNILNCEKVYMRGANIGRFNRVQCVKLTMQKGSKLSLMNTIALVKEVVMLEDSEINRRNVIMGLYEPEFEGKESCIFFLGEKSLLTVHHKIDCTSSVKVGKNVVIAGSDTQFWTHGFDVERHMITKPIVLGNNIYIGSRSLICHGVSIADNVVIGAGTCVSKSISESGFYVSNYLLRKSVIQHYDMV